MKQITNKTILKQGDKTYQPVEGDGIVYWIDEAFIEESDYAINLNTKEIKQYDGVKGMDSYWKKIVAQSQPKLEGIPVVSLDSYVEKLAKKEFEKILNNSESKLSKMALWKDGYNSNPNHYTQKDIEKAIELARETISSNEAGICDKYTELGILQQINSISIIEVDEQFNIISYN